MGEGTQAPAPADARPSLEEAAAWVGQKLDEMGGTTVARVDGVLVDVISGRPEWLAVRASRFGHRSVLPARDAVGAAGNVWVPFTREALRSAPRADATKGLTKDDELALLAHYGLAGLAGRAGELADRDPGVLTCTPA